MTTRVEQVMARHVETVAPDTGFKALVTRLRACRVSGLPVVDREGRLLGMVTEADLLLKVERSAVEPAAVGTEAASRWLRARAAGRTAAELMTAPAVSVGPDADVADAAALMVRYGVRRLPVVGAGGELLGVVSRGDVLEVFLRRDEEIRRGIMEMLPEGLGRPEVYVEGGVVHLRGEVGSAAEVEELERLAGSLDGVVGVRSRLRTSAASPAARARPGP